MTHSKCPRCNRRYRSKEAREAGEAYAAIHSALKAEVALMGIQTKQERKAANSREFQLTGNV